MYLWTVFQMPIARHLSYEPKKNFIYLLQIIFFHTELQGP